MALLVLFLELSRSQQALLEPSLFVDILHDLISSRCEFVTSCLQ
jgi:hypothetical protein